MKNFYLLTSLTNRVDGCHFMVTHNYYTDERIMEFDQYLIEYDDNYVLVDKKETPWDKLVRYTIDCPHCQHPLKVIKPYETYGGQRRIDYECTNCKKRR